MNLLSFVGGIAFANVIWCFVVEKLITKHKNEIQVMERSQEKKGKG